MSLTCRSAPPSTRRVPDTATPRCNRSRHRAMWLGCPAHRSAYRGCSLASVPRSPTQGSADQSRSCRRRPSRESFESTARYVRRTPNVRGPYGGRRELQSSRSRVGRVSPRARPTVAVGKVRSVIFTRQRQHPTSARGTPPTCPQCLSRADGARRASLVSTRAGPPDNRPRRRCRGVPTPIWIFTVDRTPSHAPLQAAPRRCPRYRHSRSACPSCHHGRGGA